MKQVAYVPDAGHKQLIELAHANPGLKSVVLTTEEEGVALLVGAHLGGERGVLLLQSSGVGNCINMLSLAAECRVPLLMLVTMRGEWGEFNPWQVTMGQATPAVLEAMGAIVLRADDADRIVETVRAAVGARVRLRPDGRGADRPARDRREGFHQMTALERRAATVRLLAGRGDALVVTGLGSTTYDAYAAGDSPLNFYLWGAMGGAAMVGLGLALAQPGRRVVVVTGDGEMLMGLGSLATIGVQRPVNLAIVVIDNGLYAETGMQATHTAHGVDLAGVARACGFEHTATVRTLSELDALAHAAYAAPGPLFAAIKVSPTPTTIELAPRDGPYLRSRLRAAVLGADAGS